MSIDPIIAVLAVLQLFSGASAGTAAKLPEMAVARTAVQSEIKTDKQIRFGFADRAEAAAFIEQNDAYYNSMNQINIDWRMGKTDATLAQLRKYAKEQVLDFTDEEKTFYQSRLEVLQKRLFDLGYEYELDVPVVFVKCTNKDELDSAAYTHANYVFLGRDIYRYYKQEIIDEAYVDEVLAHEVFHVLTRNDPDFRARMYKAIGFEIDEEIPFGEDVKRVIVSNPDVPKYDCSAYFTLNGKKKKGTIVSYFSAEWTRDVYPFEYMLPGVVFYDEPNKIYTVDEISDFWDVVGRNTDYVIAAEECMADNFAFAVTYGMDADYKDPEIPKYILEHIKE